MKQGIEEKIEILSQWLFESRYLVVFTGAGISTDSGLPDFRGPGGILTGQKEPLTPETFKKRLGDVQPNEGHLAITELQGLGKLKFLISQNIDNLHLQSGIAPSMLAELHGNVTRLRCDRCEATIDTFSGYANCGFCDCGGELESSVIDFGQTLPKKDLMLSFVHAKNSDLFIVLGSSLVVAPASDIPNEALRSGARLVIVNQGETSFDDAAHLRFYENIVSIMPRAVKKLKKLLE